MLFTKQKYYERGSKYSKILAYKLRKQQAENAINKIRDPKTQNIYPHIKEIKNCFKEYYEKLYSQPQINTDHKIETLFKSLNLPKLTEEENKIFVSPITKEAITRLKANKFPGTDRFSSEWFKSLKEALTPIY